MEPLEGARSSKGLDHGSIGERWGLRTYVFTTGTVRSDHASGGHQNGTSALELALELGTKAQFQDF
jgi:hypothetical protein